MKALRENVGLSLAVACRLVSDLVERLREHGARKVVYRWHLARQRRRLVKVQGWIVAERQQHVQNMTLLMAEREVVVERIRSAQAEVQGWLA